VLDVTLLTRGSPHQLSGGHLYHHRMVAAARSHGARLEIRSVSMRRNPFAGAGDVVLIDSLAAAAVAAWLLAGRRGSLPVAAIAHQQPGGADHGTLRTAVQRRLDAMVYRRCDLVLAASVHVAAQLADWCGVPADRICVATPGRDLPAPREPRAVDMRRGRRAAVLCVANWLPNKGVVELLEAVAALPPGAVTVHLVGRGDVDRRYGERVRSRIASPDLVGRVVVHGPLDPRPLAELYAGADVFALASYVEAYGTVYAEALSAGLPIVGWRSGNLPNLIVDGTHGILVEPGDVAALSRALHCLADDDARREAQAQAAREHSGALPTWDHTADVFFGALRRLARIRG